MSLRLEIICNLESLVKKLKNGCTNACQISGRDGMRTSAICQCGPLCTIRELGKYANWIEKSKIRSWEEDK